jgi:hypothetical protein
MVNGDARQIIKVRVLVREVPVQVQMLKLLNAVYFWIMWAQMVGGKSEWLCM